MTACHGPCESFKFTLSPHKTLITVLRSVITFSDSCNCPRGNDKCCWQSIQPFFLLKRLKVLKFCWFWNFFFSSLACPRKSMLSLDWLMMYDFSGYWQDTPLVCIMWDKHSLVIQNLPHYYCINTLKNCSKHSVNYSVLNCIKKMLPILPCKITGGRHNKDATAELRSIKFMIWWSSWPLA